MSAFRNCRINILDVWSIAPYAGKSVTMITSSKNKNIFANKVIN